jgi:hypothetical protein
MTIHFLDESSRQKLHNLLADGPVLLLVQAAQSLLNRLRAHLDPQGMLGDFPRNARHIQGLSREDVTIHTEEVDECTFLFGGKVRVDV